MVVRKVAEPGFVVDLIDADVLAGEHRAQDRTYYV
jgi:hypothetical protein